MYITVYTSDKMQQIFNLRTVKLLVILMCKTKLSQWTWSLTEVVLFGYPLKCPYTWLTMYYGCVGPNCGCMCLLFTSNVISCLCSSAPFQFHRVFWKVKYSSHVEVSLHPHLSSRDWVEKHYVEMKKANPKFPFLIRECSNINPVVYARYGNVISFHLFIFTNFDKSRYEISHNNKRMYKEKVNT